MADEEKVPQQPEEDAPSQISRRNFLVGAGAGVVTTGAMASGYLPLKLAETMEVVKEVETVKKAEPVEAIAEMAEPITGKSLVTLNVNGQDYQVGIEPQMTLAEVLRRDLGLTGTHLGCNGSYCSSCTVLLDGVAENSCSLLAIREVGKKITTIEGLEQEGELHPVQQAFWEQMGYQCGFCTSGQIMRTVELLNKIPSPSEAQIKRHLSGNLCKCSAYPNIVKAVQQAAEMMA